MTLKEKLIQICKERYKVNISQYNLEPFDKFPYIPYVPKEWNGFLVLAESQQLRGIKAGNKNYKNNLISASEYDQITRLGNKEITKKLPEEMLGIWPWDNGFIKMGLLSAIQHKKIDNYAVSNAVPWHLNKDKTHKTQSRFLKEISISFWKELLTILKPKVIICTGDIAKNIIFKTRFCVEKNNCIQINVRSASQLHWDATKDFEYQSYRELLKIFNINKKYIEPNQPQRYYIWYMNHFKNKINL